LKKILFLLILLSSFAFSVGFNTILKQPKSIEKDFFIYVYLKNHNLSKKDAKKLFRGVYHFNKKLKDEFAKYNLYPKSHKTLYQKPEFSKDFDTFIKKPPQTFLEVFSHLSTWHIEKYLDKQIPTSYMQKLAKYKRFNTFCKKVLSSSANNLKASLKGIKSYKPKAEASFYLALYNLDDTNLATFYLKQAKKNAISQFKKDRATLWLYLVTKDSNYLKTLSNSPELNIYSLYAYENLQKTFKNIVTTFNPKKQKAFFKVNDALSWAKVRRETYHKLYHLSYKQKIQTI